MYRSSSDSQRKFFRNAMITLLLVPIFMWAVVGVSIFRVATKVLKYPARCDDLETRALMKPEWVPFTRKYDTRFKRRSQFVVFLISMTTAPARILLSIVFVFLSGLASITLPTRGVAAVARWVSRSILRAMGIRVLRTGTRASVRDAPCVVANHISATDILALLSLGCCFVANNKVLDLPGIGRVAKAIGCIFVARDSQDSRTSAREAINQHLLEPTARSDSPSQLVIFAEGTTTNGRGLLQFRRGAFESGVTIQPVRIDYSDLQCSMALLSVWDLVCLLSVLSNDKQIHVQFLDPVRPAGTPDDMASLVRAKIANTKSVFSPDPLELFASGSHRDEAEMMKVVSRMPNLRHVRESM